MDNSKQLTIKLKSDLWKYKESRVHPGGLRGPRLANHITDDKDDLSGGEEETEKPFGDVKKLNLKPRFGFHS